MTDKQKVTMASVILRRFGFTNREAAQYWGGARRNGGEVGNG